MPLQRSSRNVPGALACWACLITLLPSQAPACEPRLDALPEGDLVFVIRHTAKNTEWEITDKYIPLTEEGFEQAKAIRSGVGKSPGFDGEFLSSPHTRTMQTCELIFGKGRCREEKKLVTGEYDLEWIGRQIRKDRTGKGHLVLVTHSDAMKAIRLGGSQPIKIESGDNGVAAVFDPATDAFLGCLWPEDWGNLGRTHHASRR